MSQAEELLNNLTRNEFLEEAHIVVKNDRHITVPKALRRIAVQYDHNVETVTFDCPRYWDGLDMSEMVIYINYIRADRYRGKYLAKNVVVDENDETIMHFDWTLTRNATLVNGPLRFLVCIKKVDDVEEINHWNSEINGEMHVSEGMECDDFVEQMEQDIITDLLLRMDKILVADSPILDTTLTERGLAADAKVVGDRLDEVEVSLNETRGILSSSISKETVDRKSEIDIERKRIDNFTSLKNGSTTGDAELIDIRTGADGKSYNSAGDAVRSQYGYLQNSISQLASGEIIGYVDLFGNIKTDYDVWRMIDHLIPIKAVTSVKIYLWKDVLCISYYDEKGNFIGGEDGSGQPQQTGEALTTFANAPKNAVYFKYCWRINYNVEPTVVYSNTIDALISEHGRSLTRIEENAEAISNLSIVDFAKETRLYNEWSSGYYNNGVQSTSKYGWRTNGIYDCSDIDLIGDPNAKIDISIGDAYSDTYKVTIVVYDSDGNFLSDIGRKTANDLGGIVYSNYGNRLKFAAYLMRIDDQIIEDIDNEIVNDILVVKKTSTEKANVRGLEEFKSELSNFVNDVSIDKIAFIGDSFTWLDVYTKKVVEFVGASGYTNYGFNGLSIVNVCNQKMNDLATMSDCDAMTFWMGTNDFGQEKPLGEYDSTDTSTITGAFRTLCEFFSEEQFANMSKLIITPCQRWGYDKDPIKNNTMTNSLGITLETISERIKDVAHEYGFRVLDFYHSSGINKTTSAWLTRDGLHPTDNYFERLAINIAAELKTLP